MPAPVAFNVQQNSQNANTSQKVLLYDASGNPISSTAGALNVSLVSPSTFPVSGSVSVSNFPSIQNSDVYTGSGDTRISKKVGTLLASANQPASGAVMVSPTASMYTYVTGFTLSIGPNCTGSALTFLTLIWVTTGGAIGQFLIALGGAGLTSGTYPPVNNFPGFYAANPTVNDGIQVIHNITGGNFAVQINYGYTATP